MRTDKPAGVLFDVDGTLVDTTYLHTVSWAEALRQAGRPISMARIHRAIGMGSDKLLDHLLGDDRDRGGDDALRTVHDELMAGYASRLQPLPGAVELLRACARRGLRVVLASSAAEHELAKLRGVLDAEDVIDAATSSADAQVSKPAPDILVAALDRAGLDRSRVIFVGDSVWDVQAAGRIGVACIALTCGGTSRAELAQAGAVAVYEDPAQLLSDLDRTPLAALA
ncbi:HAD family hydrolase [Micromonosporaceae bacterium DT55]|uniref:HAD family hydrolase n=1 Tax=Melissospora conviva TaxID=3388432 RepID=UPI003C25905D